MRRRYPTARRYGRQGEEFYGFGVGEKDFFDKRSSSFANRAIKGNDLCSLIPVCISCLSSARRIAV
jgi:hypothetical protein